MHAKYEVFISYGSEVIAKVKVDKQTDRQDKNNMPPIIRSRGIKIKAGNMSKPSFLKLEIMYGVQQLLQYF